MKRLHQHQRGSGNSYTKLEEERSDAPVSIKKRLKIQNKIRKIKEQISRKETKLELSNDTYTINFIKGEIQKLKENLKKLEGSVQYGQGSVFGKPQNITEYVKSLKNQIKRKNSDIRFIEKTVVEKADYYRAHPAEVQNLENVIANLEQQIDDIVDELIEIDDAYVDEALGVNLPSKIKDVIKDYDDYSER